MPAERREETKIRTDDRHQRDRVALSNDEALTAE